MPRPRPPYLTREVTRHGKAVWYVRVRKGRRIRIKAEYGSPEFMAAYEIALSRKALDEQRKPASGTLTWLIARYRDTTVWSDLSLATRRQRENIFRQVIESAGADPYARITRAHIVAGLDRWSKTPAQARHFLDTMRGLFRWAFEAGLIKTDPTVSIKNPAIPKGEGFAAWTETDVTRYEARWPIGTKERVWLDVLQYTGLRRGDAVRLGRQHVRDGIATIRTEKSQEQITVSIPILPVLAARLAAGPCGDLTFICGNRGTPLTKESFGNEFGRAARAAGINKSAHGLRKIGATRAAENGATVAQLEAIFGWHGGGMAALYTRKADRARLAREAMDKLLARTPREQAIPAPDGKVRAPKKK